MKISSLKLFSFRNYREEILQFHPFVNFFWGSNGQGKTNLVEAIYFLSRASSFRVNKKKTFEVLPLKEENFSETSLTASLRVKFEEDDNRYDLFWKFSEKRSQFFLNQKKILSSQLFYKFPLVLFSPESLSVIKEGPSERRNLLDEFLIGLSSQNIELYKNFKKSLKMKKQILRDYKEGKLSLTIAKDLLFSLNPSYLNFSSQITDLRIRTLRELKPFLEESFKRFFKGRQVPVIIEYFISSERALDWTFSEIYDKLSYKLEKLLDKELETGMNLVSPQKHDIVFFVNKEDSRYYCSQAQQRVLILSFKIAQAMYYKKNLKRHPVLLLDDIFSELDEKRKEILIEFLKDYRGQLFLTGTDVEKVKSKFEEKRGRIFEVKEGKVLTCQM